MKKCPFCAEEIQEEAVKCRFCGEFLIDAELRDMKKGGDLKWYYRTPFVIVALLFIGGPFALPLVWFNPQYGKITKVVITILILILTAFAVALLVIYIWFIGRIATNGLNIFNFW